MSNRKFLLALLAGFSMEAVIFTACTSAPKKPAEEANLSPEEKKKFDEFREEQEIGRNMAGRLLKFYGNQRSDELLGYVNQVGAYVASYGDYPERRYMFEILDSETVNAFACPGGYILVTMGAVRHARNEAELAMVLGHEVAHVGKRHMFDALKAMSAEEIEKAAAEENAKLPESLKARERPKPDDSEAQKILARYLSGGNGLGILKAAKAGMSLMMEKGLGAEKEFEADREGVKYGVRAGYEPDALEEYLCRLEKTKLGKNTNKKHCRLSRAEKKSKGDGKSILDKTHPAPADRIGNIREVLAQLNADDIVGAQGKARFIAMKKLLPEAKDESNAE